MHADIEPCTLPICEINQLLDFVFPPDSKTASIPCSGLKRVFFILLLAYLPTND
jgi:hypothetical protein